MRLSSRRAFSFLMAKQGFKNQWIAISQKGKFKDSEGVERHLNDDFLNQVISNTKPNDAPAVVGHPKDNSPAFGWATALRLNNGVLEAQFADTDDQFEQMVEEGKFRKRSASFYLNPPQLRHVGFLGAMPPAVKGLRDIQFNDGESVTVEISFNEEQIMKDEEVDKVAESFLDKLKNMFKTESSAATAAPTTNFSEADAKKLVEDAVAKVKEEAKAEAKAAFAEELKTRDDQIKTLLETVDASSTSGRRSEIASFVESIPAEKGKHFLKRAGITDFMESLAIADGADKEPAINFSEGEGDAKVEHKFSRLDWFKNYVNAQQSFVEFGEKFGTLTATAAANEPLKNAANMNEMRDEMGVKKTGGEK